MFFLVIANWGVFIFLLFYAFKFSSSFIKIWWSHNHRRLGFVGTGCFQSSVRRLCPFQCWDGDFWSVNGGKVGCKTTRKTTHSCHWHASMDSSTCSSVACNHLTFFLKRFCNKYSRTFRGLSLAATDLRDWTVVLGLNFVVLFDLFSFYF